ncbi:hypothetical protein GCM10010435_65950 [Winogradskya consettensis]|uniref:Uncharacterized protein n=1 Tax=Winogradskya consettensis TaxID=113560 RepID=A0A919T4M8_9ACTN|nr:hypothetical protein [Actinoplanes consettensis]GIM84783.1 hypothetical protein Aco04nite_93130 [Actinoplanes consettensis]
MSDQQLNQQHADVQARTRNTRLAAQRMAQDLADARRAAQAAKPAGQ